MPNFDIDVSVNEIYDAMSKYEKLEMYDLLKQDFKNENGLVCIIGNFNADIPEKPSLMDEELLKSLLKIFSKRSNLSFEEEQHFIDFSKKL